MGELAGGVAPELVWRNQLGGLTWRLGGAYLKWSPDAAGIDLDREVERLRRLHGRHPSLTMGSWSWGARFAGLDAPLQVVGPPELAGAAAAIGRRLVPAASAP